VRDGAWVAEAAGVLDLSGWPAEMRVIVRKERPHPGAQLRLTDRDGLRLTAFATNTGRGQLPDLELRHRRRARVEDRIPPPRTPACTIFCCTVSTRTGYGARSCNWPSNSPRGCRCWPCTIIQPAAGNPNGHGCGCFRSPPASQYMPDAPDSRLAAHTPWADLLTTALARLQPG
jgi:hypothetical protein